MSIEELNKQIAEKAEQINILQKICDEQKRVKKENFQKVTNLFSELSRYQKEYYEFRTLLGFGDLTEEQFDQIESLMPIYEKKINHLKEQLGAVKPQDFL